MAYHKYNTHGTPAECVADYWIWHGIPTQEERREARTRPVIVEEARRPTGWRPVVEEATETRGEGGKWMLFYDLSKINNRWEEAKEQYDSGNLCGVDYMKVATNKPNPRAQSSATKVIILYCSDSDNESKIMDIGRRIIYYMQYDEQPYIYYKTHSQTNAGTSATGSKKNHLYRAITDIDRDEYEASNEV